jgi:hypothetical protein
MATFKYEIEKDTNFVRIFQNNVIAITQPFDPNTYLPFATTEEASAWAEGFIFERESWYEEPGDSQLTSLGIEE